MPRQIYVNLPVKNLNRSQEFFSALGFEFNPKYTDDKAACLIVGENIYVMLLIEEFFNDFTSKPIADAHKTTEVLLCINTDTRAGVDELVTKARNAGGAVPREPQDHGFMYQHGFEDLDGHIWEIVYLEQ